MGKWAGLNRRKFPRVKYPCLVVARNQAKANDNIILTHTDNIGIGGVCITLKKSVEMFSSVGLEIDLLDMEKNIKCEGKVVWSIRRKMDAKKKPLFYDTGIEFTLLDSKEKARLESIVKKMVKLNRVVPFV